MRQTSLLWDNGAVKILVLTPHYYPEGFSITSICERWAKQGHDVFVVTNRPNYGYGHILPEYRHVKDEMINGVRVHRCFLFARKKSRLSIIANYLSFYASSSLYLSHLKEDFDVVYSFSLSPIIAVSGANKYKKKHHVPHYLHCLDLWPESVLVTHAMKKKSLGYRLLYRWSKSIYSKADEILVSSPSFESYFRDELELKDIPIAYVPQPAFLSPQEGDDIVYSTPNNFLYAGNIGSLQLVENLALGFSLLKEGEATLHIIGMGSRKEAVESLIKEKGLQDRVIYHGPLPRKKTSCYYKNCEGIIVSLKDEGYVGKTIPNKLISSLSFGKPIFALIGGDGKALLEKTGGAFFGKSESPEDIAEGIRLFLTLSEEEKKAMGQKNLSYFQSHFEFGKTVDDITSILSSGKKK